MSSATYWTTQLAVAVSAAAGVLQAGEKRFALFGMILIAFVAALGGGSLREVLLNRTVFWVADQNYLPVALGAGLASCFAACWVRLPASVFRIPDAAGFAPFTVAGPNVALTINMPWLVASLMGAITGVVGGVLRDVLSNEEPLVFRGTLYATVAWRGSLLLILAIRYGAEPGLAAVATGILILVVRLIAIRWDIGLPTFQSR